jgi:hypothetical protein
MKPCARGSATIEMTLVGIPIIFMLISIFEIARGMWMYETLAFSVREGVRFATVHGQNCVYTPPSITNNCAKTAAEVVSERILPAAKAITGTTKITFTAPYPGGASFDCYLSGTGNAGACGSVWPPAGDNEIGTVIKITMQTPFNSALAMFWPGSSPTKFNMVTLGASATDRVVF